jgi:AcrR family transcriptional regulator
MALEQLAAGGVEAISLKAIATALGLTGPAIYRYFATRNALLTELIVDAYDDLATTIAAVPPHRAGADRLHALAAAYRDWALAQPHRYRLLFAAPVPGYDANADRLVAAADRSMAVFLEAYAEADPAGADAPLPRGLTAQLRAWARRHERDADRPDVLYRGVVTWTRLHGLVSLELEGAFASMEIDADAVFRRELAALAGR